MTDKRRAVVTTPDLSHKAPTLDTPHPAVPERIANTAISLQGGAADDDKFVPFAFGLVETEGSIRYAQQILADLWIVRALCLGEREATIYGGEQAGECDGLVGIYTDYSTFGSPNFTSWWHSGSLSQTADANLAAMIGWTETLVITDPTGKRRAICYAVERWANVASQWSSGIQKIRYRFRGSRVKNTTTGTVVYTTNAWWQARFWALDPAGALLKPSRINETSFQTAAANSPSGSYESNMLLSGTTQDCRKQFALLGAGSLVFAGGNQLTAIADRGTDPPVATYDDSHFSIDKPIEIGPVADPDQMVNKVSIEYTDTTDASGVWKLVTVSLSTAGLLAGTETEVAATYKLPQLHALAAVQMMLGYLLYDYQQVRVKGNWLANAGGPRLIGDVVTQAIPARGISNNFRIAVRDKQPNGTYDVELQQIDARKWAGATSAPAAKTGSTLHDPYAPPDIMLGTITWTEEMYADQFGQYWPRVILGWTNPAYAFIDGIEAYIAINGGTRRSLPGDVVSPAMINDVMEVGASYTITLVVRSSAGYRSAGTSITRTINGAAAPATPIGFSAASNNDYAFLSWMTVADPSVTWELREGLTTDTWSTATPLGKLSHPTFIASPRYGQTVRYFLKAVAYGQYSAGTATVDVAFGAVGGQSTEVVSSWVPDLTNFTRQVAFGWNFGTDSYMGLWASGDLRVLVTPSPNGAYLPGFPYVITAWLSRSITPATINAEMAAAGLTTIAQWCTQIDNPRRGGQGLWAPLPANANGEIWGAISNSYLTSRPIRLCEARLRLTSVTHTGNDVPATDGLAQVIVVDDPASPAAKPVQRGSVFAIGPEARSRGYGFRLASNNPFYQQQISSVAGAYPVGGPLALSYTQRSYLIQSGSVSTDGSGIASISFSYPPLAGTANAKSCYTVRAVAGAGSAKIFVVDHLENTPTQTLRVKMYNDDGTVASGITVVYELIDNGSWPSSGTFWP